MIVGGSDSFTLGLCDASTDGPVDGPTDGAFVGAFEGETETEGGAEPTNVGQMTLSLLGPEPSVPSKDRWRGWAPQNQIEMDLLKERLMVTGLLAALLEGSKWMDLPNPTVKGLLKADGKAGASLVPKKDGPIHWETWNPRSSVGMKAASKERGLLAWQSVLV